MITTLIALAVTSSPLPQIDEGRLLSAIRQVEGHKWSDPGGAYAIQPTTWKQHSKLPYRYASSPDHADEVGRRHIHWIIRTLRDDGIPVSAYSIAGCWRFGFEGFRRRKDRIDYATRVANLYHDR